MSNKSITDLASWHALIDHQKAIKDVSIMQLFAGTKNRYDLLHESMDGLLYDYSKHHVSHETMSLLLDLARERDLEGWRDRMFTGRAINNSEDRSVLHPALRGSVAKSLMVDGENVLNFVRDTHEKMRQISDKIRNDTSITDVVNIGIGGSDLGARMVCEALHDFADGPNVHFVSNVDAQEITQLLKTLKPDNTVFIIASKTFTTLETMMNANSAKSWLETAMGAQSAASHFYAISTNEEAAERFGIAADHILPLRDWVGGRYSVWGAVGLPIAVSIGFNGFQKFLEGAHAMDMHFQKTPLEHNIPVLMALIGIWYNNFCGQTSMAVLPYSQSLQRFPAYLQQLDMESNGKCVTRDGDDVNYATGPLVFGEAGTNGQHAFFQLLHQGTQIIPADFIVVINPNHTLYHHHEALLANALAQSKALMQGEAHPDTPHRHFKGNRPNAMLLLNKLDAYHLGMLMALYEHKIFVQGILWNINSFDQWGVELGKQLAKPITDALEKGAAPENLGSSTRALIATILEKFIKS